MHESAPPRTSSAITLDELELRMVGILSILPRDG
jgi:hypothetical protein